MTVLFGHYGPEYITHLINYGQNNPNSMKQTLFIFIALTPQYTNCWCVNPMTNDDLQIFLGSVDHNMKVEDTLGP